MSKRTASGELAGSPPVKEAKPYLLRARDATKTMRSRDFAKTGATKQEISLFRRLCKILPPKHQRPEVQWLFGGTKVVWWNQGATYGSGKRNCFEMDGG